MTLYRMAAAFLTLLIFSLSSSALSQAVSLASSGSSASNQSRALEFHNGGLIHTVEQTEAGQFYVVGVKGAGFTNVVGKPQLPVLRSEIEVPLDAHPSLQVLNAKMEEISLSSWGNDLRIIPLQQPVPRLPKVSIPFAFDVQSYTQNGYINTAVAKIAGEKIERNRKYVTVEVNLVDYDPAQGKIRVYSDVQVSLSYSALPGKTLSRYDSKSFSGLTPNPAITQASGAREGFLIVTPPEFQQALSTFIQEKQKKFDVTVVTTSVTGATTTGIKAYIQNAYDTWPIPPVYVLLVGDVDRIPCWWSSIPTDLYYSTVQGTDYIPDLYVGRVSVADASQLSNWVTKALQTQQTKVHSWTAGADQTPLGYGLGVDDETNYCITHYYDSLGWQSTKNYVTDYGSATVDRITSDLNKGVGMVYYSGHGASSGWVDGISWSKYDVDGLSNTTYPVVVAFGCNTGEFTQDECIGESWIRATHGSTAYVGSTVTSSWREDGYLDRGIYSAYHSGINTLGQIVAAGKHQVFLEEGDVPKVQSYYEQYNILGDPSQEILSTPGQVTAAPFPPALLSPANGALNQPMNPVLHWNSSSGASSYRIQLSTDPSFSAGTLLINDSVTSTSRQTGWLDTGKTYYWRVNAMNTVGVSTFSGSWSFTTVAAQTAATDDWLYRDNIVTPWRDSSWSSTIDYASTEQVYSGTSSIKVSQTEWGAISMRSGPMGGAVDVTPTLYSGFEFEVYNTTPGLVLNVYAYNDLGDPFPDNLQTNVPTNQWTLISVPMSSLNPSGYVIHRINIQNYTRLIPTYYVDNVRLVGASSVSAADDRPSALPSKFALEQNYPNPFNPSTRLSYELPKDAMVRLSIFDVLGQLVVTMVDQVQHAGNWSAEWRATNSHGSPVASGVYICRLEATRIDDPSRTFVELRRMVLIR